jgi:hypothetical protein
LHARERNREPVVRVAVVVIQEVRLIEPVRNEQVERAVVVVIGPPAAERVAAVGDRASGRDLVEAVLRRPQVLVQEVVLAVVRDEQVEVAVVVEVAKRAADRIAGSFATIDVSMRVSVHSGGPSFRNRMLFWFWNIATNRSRSPSLSKSPQLAPSVERASASVVFVKKKPPRFVHSASFLYARVAEERSSSPSPS